MSEPAPQAPPSYRVRYYDDALGYEWFAEFETDQQALDQAAVEVIAYGGVAPQEVLDQNDAVVHDQGDIIAASEDLPG